MKQIIDKEPIFSNAISKLEKISMNKTLLNEYEIRRRAEMDYKATVDYSFNKGIEQGIQKDKIHTAKRMLLKNIDITLISEITGLSEEEIHSLQ